MIVYADVLILVNFVVNYFILRLTAKLDKTHYLRYRIILGSFMGGMFSLYIFLPQSAFMLELALHFSICFLMAFTAFGFVNLKEFIK